MPEEATPVGGPREPTLMDRISGVGEGLRRALLLPTLALVLALVVGAVIIMLTDVDAWLIMGEDPGAALASMFEGVVIAYRELFIGAFGSVRGISETLFTATPLILAGLAVAIGFQAGLFNIGATGQMFIGGLAATWVALHVSLPMVLHLPLAVLAAIVGGGLWGGLAGFLKAKTGAHEVITTIMLNFIGGFFVLWALKTPAFNFDQTGVPQSAPLSETARFPTLFGDDYRVNASLLLAIGAVFLMRWLLYKSTIGFEFRSAGASPSASLYAGMNVATLITLVMVLSGALAGIAGSAVTLGLPPYRVADGFPGTIGFDAIALALLGRSHPIGVLWSGLLFGALITGGRTMQAAAGVSVDLVIVIQALIIMFIAAPELVRAVFRVKTDGLEAEQVTRGWGA